MSVLNVSREAQKSQDNIDEIKRKRRKRTIFTLGAVRKLEAVFAKEHYPDIALREHLARQIGVSEARIQTWFQNKRSRSRRGHRYLVDSTQNAAGEAAKHLKPKTTENDTSEPDGSSLRANFGKTSTSNSLFRPYDPDIGTGRTTDSNGDSTAQIGGHKLVGYITVVNPHDGQCYLQPLPVSSRFTASSYRIVNPPAFFSGSSLMPSPLPTYMPFSSSMMLPISPSLSSYLPRSSIYHMLHMSGLKTAFLPLPTTQADH